MKNVKIGGKEYPVVEVTRVPYDLNRTISVNGIEDLYAIATRLRCPVLYIGSGEVVQLGMSVSDKPFEIFVVIHGGEIYKWAKEPRGKNPPGSPRRGGG